MTIVFEHQQLPVESFGVAQNNGVYGFVAEFWNATERTGQVYVRRYTPIRGLSVARNVGNDPAGLDRLVKPGARASPSIAIDADTILIAMKRDEVGYGPTIEGLVVDLQQGRLVLNPPSLIDDDSRRSKTRGHSGIAVNDTLGDVWSCWTYHVNDKDDNIYCRGRRSGATEPTWSENILPLATTRRNIEDHPSVTVQTSTGRRVAAYHTKTGVKVRLFDLSNNEDRPNDVSLGAGAKVNFPHIIDANGILHAVVVDSAKNQITYASCAIYCHVNANWNKEIIDDIAAAGDVVAYPQIAVDVDGHVFVAFQHTPAGQGSEGERVKVTARCAVDGWDNDGGELIDATQGREEIGGHEVEKSHPAFVADFTNSLLSVVYVQEVGGTNRIGRWARKNATLTYNDICAGQ